MTLLRVKLRMIQEANKALIKRRRVKRTRLQEGSILSIEDAYSLIAKKAASRQKKSKEVVEGGLLKIELVTVRYCSYCRKSRYNI